MADNEEREGGVPEAAAAEGAAGAPGEQRARTEWQVLGERVLSSENRLALAILAGVLAVVLGVVIYQTRKQSAAREAAFQLSQVQTVQNLQDLLGRYPKTPTAPVAMLMLARAYYDTGNYPLADSTYAEFAVRYPGHVLGAEAKLGQLHCQEAQGLLEQAQSGFAEFISRDPGHFLAPVAVMGRARCLEQLGRRGEARSVYEDFVVDHPKSPWVPEMESAMRRLERETAEPVAPAGENAADNRG